MHFQKIIQDVIRTECSQRLQKFRAQTPRSVQALLPSTGLLLLADDIMPETYTFMKQHIVGRNVPNKMFDLVLCPEILVRIVIKTENLNRLEADLLVHKAGSTARKISKATY
ncbi:PREDICTED: uncharacterized protein LOC106820719 [Priapulus caudatus]|uniref:Uncharacterized protein LOC106820719 n=1 Tax=Priapulus caudatus TaxID=37621 RepID=A0ABM1F8E3_PRICU|nr:PREDICTED: uncharacterized protein LOC106820719 [Priapulus caudatus]